VVGADHALAPDSDTDDRGGALEEVRASRVTEAGAGIGLEVQVAGLAALAWRDSGGLVEPRPECVVLTCCGGGASADRRDQLRGKVEPVHKPNARQVRRRYALGCVLQYQHGRVGGGVALERIELLAAVA
jgi:hypothetical protein